MSKLNLTDREMEIIRIINSAIDSVVKSRIKLLGRGRVERTITARLASAIESNLGGKDITADPFYNKHLEETKRLNSRVIELDIAVHSAGNDDNNLVAIELETCKKPTMDDIWKIEGLTHPESDYKYQLGLYLALGIEEMAGLILVKQWYKDGQQIKF